MQRFHSLPRLILGCCFLTIPVFSLAMSSDGALTKTEIKQTVITQTHCLLSAVVSGKQQVVAKILPGQSVWLNGVMKVQNSTQFGQGNAMLAPSCRVGAAPGNSNAMPEEHTPMQGYLVTKGNVRLYADSRRDSAVVAELKPHLRYPFMAEQDGWYKVRFGGKTLFIAAPDVEKDRGIAVLTYHHLLKNAENRYFRQTSTTTSVTAFEQQMALLKQQGYRTISLYDIENYLNGSANFSDKLVSITFDDGLESVYRYAFPILKKYHFNATIFVISSRIKYALQPWDPNQLQFITRTQYQEMQPLVDLQSHTHFLHRLLRKQPIMLRRSLHNMLVDFRRSIQVLHEFNPKVRYLAYPYGSYTSLAKKAAEQAGFHLAFSTQIGKVNFGDDRYQLKRIYLLKEDNPQQILQKLAQ
ncbi:polysaccharide deacetylase family protein [Testudinibacter sp. TR-2022]|nr:polysaccharide deacetylase family protein [Pasteurellaceae bacterium Phil31]TNH07600.1 polysaccharide deacetylase family protein [Testudinibacter sp. TR-2022]TNH10625.1 polysaccharide deacetylase family protein [Testudinibacter sp. TR-2022]TNH11943.1 polysaccharide deacetylase family protein [Testudinibacter sp. TR-2022]TNH17014.1 polysaccharide deacetylase family protein [Testudinibacter sp. TR-2022]